MILKSFTNEPVEIPENNVIAILKAIFEDKVYAEYAGGSLTYDHHGNLLIFNVGQSDNPHINYWVAKIYLKWKTDSHFYFKRAMRIVDEYRRKISGS